MPLSISDYWENGLSPFLVPILFALPNTESLAIRMYEFSTLDGADNLSRRHKKPSDSLPGSIKQSASALRRGGMGLYQRVDEYSQGNTSEDAELRLRTVVIRDGFVPQRQGVEHGFQ